MSPAWERLCGGPCDGTPVWVDPSCWAVAVYRDSDRGGWTHHDIELNESFPELVANEAHLYIWADARDGFVHAPNVLSRSSRDGRLVWELQNP